MKPENGFPPMAQSLWTQHHQHSILCSSMQNVHWWSQRCLSFLVPLYEAGNGMSGPMHGYLIQMSYLTLARLLFAVALWMYNCVLGKLHVAPCWDLTKHLLQMWLSQRLQNLVGVIILHNNIVVIIGMTQYTVHSKQIFQYTLSRASQNSRI